MPASTANAYLSKRPLVLGLSKLFFVAVAQLPIAQAAPLYVSTLIHSLEEGEEGKSPDDPDLWLYLGVAAALVLLGGAFAGLTIALMGQVGSSASKIVGDN